MARRLGYVNSWQLAITPPHNAIYVFFHLFMHIAYVGNTTVAFIRRLHKHMANALSSNDCATLHLKMSTTDLSHLGIIPLQYVIDDFQASVHERHWWFVLRKCAINDVAASINKSGDSKKERGFLNKRVLRCSRASGMQEDWMTTPGSNISKRT